VVENEAKAMAMGATAFHAKPIDRGWLLAQLQAVLSPEQSNVLIVDDDEISRYLVKGVLAGKGYRIVEARSGNEGLKLAKETRPNLIILDLSMPDLNGFEVLAALKQDSGTCGIPVVIYTSQVLDSDERARLEAAVDIVPKETKSREAAEVRFAEALMRAGLRMKANPSEVHA
jgi:CheY-like chemotaxis protein